MPPKIGGGARYVKHFSPPSLARPLHGGRCSILIVAMPHFRITYCKSKKDTLLIQQQLTTQAYVFGDIEWIIMKNHKSLSGMPWL